MYSDNRHPSNSQMRDVPPSSVGSASASSGFFPLPADHPTSLNDASAGRASEGDRSITYDPSGFAQEQGNSAKRAHEGDDSGKERAQAKPRTFSVSSVTVKKDPQGASGGEGAARRAAQACLRCRKQKLKCVGGWPCDRCTKSKNVCDFGRPGLGPQPRDGPVTTEANARLEQLESSVANLLAGLAGGKSQYPNGEMLHTFDPEKRRAEISSADQRAYPPQNAEQWSTTIPPPTHTRPVDPPRSSHPGIPLSVASPEESAGIPIQNHVRFTSSPQTSFIAHNASPSVYGSSGTGPSPASTSFTRTESADRATASTGRKKKGKGQNAEERLATATEADFDEAPFKALVYQPAVWDNREQSRRSSPQLSQNPSRDEPPIGTYEKRVMRDADDPVNTELVDIKMAETLFNFFIDHCHPFLPVVNVALDDAFNTIRQSPFLISAIIAVGSRFYIRFTSRSPGAYPPLDPSIPQRLANLAEAHLANTLLRKQHALSDVQAVLLLAAWGLQSGGRGPDAWVVTGHAARIARRLGVHKVLGQAAELARMTRPNTDGWEKLETFMPQWRTWLCWFCFDGFLSLGFGRPQSTQFETVDEQGFLQIRLNQALPRPGSTPSISLYGDVYIAGQVQLTQIGRDLINWGEMLADPRSALWADPRRADMFHDRELNVKNMFKDLNARLDDWSRLWVWSGSPYTLYLGSSARIARLQADHMRLCLNSFALKSGPNEDEIIAQCLKKALNAAMSTIQTHFESSQTDLALSFATDYLTITLAQAAVFLVRIAKAAPATQAVTSIDPSVIAHYLRMSIDLLDTGELSETRLSTYLAKTIRDIARAADISGLGLPEVEENDPESRPISRRNSVPPPDLNGSGSAGGSADLQMTNFDMDSFLQFESQLDLSYLLGLPGDNEAVPVNLGGGGTVTPNNIHLLNSQQAALGGSLSGGLGSGGGGGGGLGGLAEFTFGMNGMGMGGMGGLGGFGFDLNLNQNQNHTLSQDPLSGIFAYPSETQAQSPNDQAL